MVDNLLPTLFFIDAKPKRTARCLNSRDSICVPSFPQSRSFPLLQPIHAGTIIVFAIGSLGSKKTNRWYLHGVSTPLEALLTEENPY